uniref:MAP kinase-activating death domain-containing protein n=1 Tax=Timema poppense TaxID=170557 RepID=A0A7R9CNS6_TIMPO|nr:unnamed protein product [Timema poppensis]
MSRMLVACSGVLKFFVRLDHIRKCFTQKGGIFVLEEYSKPQDSTSDSTQIQVLDGPPDTDLFVPYSRTRSAMRCCACSHTLRQVRNKRDSREEWSPKGPPPQDATDPYSDGCPANCPSSSWRPRWTLVVSTACHGYEL